jgi:hypothetical protein
MQWKESVAPGSPMLAAQSDDSKSYKTIVFKRGNNELIDFNRSFDAILRCRRDLMRIKVISVDLSQIQKNNL